MRNVSTKGMSMKVKTLITLFAILLTAQARADLNVIDVGDSPRPECTWPKGCLQKENDFFTKANSFRTEDPKAIQADTLRYVYRLQEFSDWKGSEKKLLNLFDGFQGKPDHTLMVYIGKATFILNKPADQVNLRPFVTLESGIKTVDMKIQTLSSNDLMTKEATATYRNPPPPAQWCANDNNTLCTSTRFVLPGDFQAGLKDEADKVKSKFKFLDAQGESKIYSGAEIPNANEYAALTGINSKVSGLAVQNAFWFTHILAFGKNVFVFQPNPNNPAQTIVTSYLVYDIEHKHWDRKKELLGVEIKLADFFRGFSAANDDKGIPQGLPKYTQQILKNIANVLSH